MKSKRIGQENQSDNEFARLLEESFKTEETLSPGSYAMAAISFTGGNGDHVMIKTDKGEGIVEKKELLDENGMLIVNRGQKIPVFFTETKSGEKYFTTVPSGSARQKILESAMENRVPMNGKITGKNKGGFEIQIGEVSAFCPASQMGAENPSQGLVIPFMIMEVSDRKVVVSNRYFKEKEKERQLEELQDSLQEGDVVSGPIASVRDFGAFMDLGGIEGLIPASELSYHRIDHPSEVVKSGDVVRARVLQIDWKENRITLSYRAMLSDPWQGNLPFSEGQVLEGEIENTRNFGIFVSLPGKFSGLVHNSETGLSRGQSPEKHFNIGDKVNVMIIQIDRENKKIGLSLKRVKEAELENEYQEYMQKVNDEEQDDSGISSFGRLLKASLEKKKN